MKSMMTRFTRGGNAAAGARAGSAAARLFGQQCRQRDRAEARPQLRQPLPPRQRALPARTSCSHMIMLGFLTNIIQLT